MKGFKHSKPDTQVVRASGTKDLDAQRDAITKLYWEEDRDREEVMGIMESQYNFKATERQYKDAFKRWGLRKNATNSDMKHMIRIRKRRFEEDGKKTEFSLYKRRVPDAKIDRFVQRTGFEAKMMMSEASITGETPPAIDYKMPSECNSVTGTPQAVPDALSSPPSPAQELQDMALLTLEGLDRSRAGNIGRSQLFYQAIELNTGSKSVAMLSNIAPEFLDMTSIIYPEDGLGTIPENQIYGTHNQTSHSGILYSTEEVLERADANVTEIMDRSAHQPPDVTKSNESSKKGNELEDLSIPDQESALPDVIEVNHHQEIKHYESHHGDKEDLLIISKELFERSATTRSSRHLSQPLNDEALGSCLRAAASRGDRLTIQTSLGLSKRIVNKCSYLSGRTALHNAAFAGHCDIIHDLLHAGANPYLAWYDGDAKRRGPYHHTALTLAILAGQVDAVETLVSSICTTTRGLYLSNRSTSEIKKAVKFAMETERQACLETLVTRVCNRSDFDWDSIVHFAVDHFHFEGLRTLMRHEIEIDLPSPMEGCFPLTRTILSANPLSLKMAEFLAQSGVNVNRVDRCSSGYGHSILENMRDIKFAEFRTSQGLWTIRTVDSEVMCPLSFSFIDPHITLVLLQNGADPNFENHKGITPLHLAAAIMDGALQVQMLLIANANPNIRDWGGSTPLHWAAASQIPNHDVIESLVRAGADLHLKNDAQHTPIDYLRLYHSIESLDWFSSPVKSSMDLDSEHI